MAYTVCHHLESHNWTVHPSVCTILWTHPIQASVHAQQNGVAQVLARNADEVNDVHFVATEPTVLILHLRAEGEEIG